MKCNICKNDMEYRETLENVCLDVKELCDDRQKTTGVNVDFFYCSTCRHGQISDQSQQLRYKDYTLRSVKGKEAVQGNYQKELIEYYDRMFEQLIEKTRKGCIIDIGSGPGILFSRIASNYDRAIAVEPSAILAEYAKREYDFDVLNVFWNDYVDIPDNSADAIICMEVLEHVNNLQEFVQVMYMKMKDDAIAFIDVPNGERIVTEAEFWNVYPEHINYFSIEGLCRLFSECGFHVIMAKEEFGDTTIAMFVKKKKMKLTFHKKHELLLNSIYERLERHSTVGGWGAGNKTASFFSDSKYQLKISYLFDKNESYSGKFVPGCDVPIMSPSIESISRCDAIIIFAMSYKDAIIDELVNNYRFKGEIICIE